jgi:hypothetical protein
MILVPATKEQLRNHTLFIVKNQPVPFDIRVWSEALIAKEEG